MHRLFINIKDGGIEVHQSGGIVRINGDDEGVQEFNRRMKKWISNGGGYICSSSVDWPEDYGMTIDQINEMFDGV